MTNFVLPMGQCTSAPNGGCWVCCRKDESYHDHHIIPQANGGRNGPRVLLCASCHNTVHHAAQLKSNAARYNALPNRKGKFVGCDSILKADYLINLILTAERKTKESSNKTTKINLTLSGDENAKLTLFARRMNLSKQNAIKYLLSKISI